MAKRAITQNSSKVKFLFKRSDDRKAELRRLYDRLMERARGREYVSGLHERHHVKPRCLGGGDESSNIVVLTFGEHFLAHYILAIVTEGENRYPLLFALKQMTLKSKFHSNRKITRRQYSLSKQAFVEATKLPEHSKKTSEGMSRRKEEMGEEDYSTWWKQMGSKISSGWNNLKNDKPNEYGKFCSTKSDNMLCVWTRRKNGLCDEEYSEWRAKVGLTSSEARLTNSPQVRCISDGRIHRNSVSAAKFYGLKSDKINYVCKGQRKHTGGLRFEYV